MSRHVTNLLPMAKIFDIQNTTKMIQHDASLLILKS